MPNGYSDAMRIFTKILIPPFTFLRKFSPSYLGKHWECTQNINDTIYSVLISTQTINILGFTIDRKAMTMTLIRKKNDKIQKLFSIMLGKSKQNMRKVAQLLGNLSATFEAVPYGKLHYREIEADKIKALRISSGNFDEVMVLSKAARSELSWWEK